MNYEIDWDKELQNLILQENPYPLKISFEYKDDIITLRIQISNADNLVKDNRILLESDTDIVQLITNILMNALKTLRINND